MLAGRVRGAPHTRNQARRRVDEHDQTSAPAQTRKQPPGQQVGSTRVDRELVVEVSGRRRFEGTRAKGARGVHQQIDAVAERRRLRLGGVDHGGFGEIAGHGPDDSGRSLQLAGDRPKARPVPTHENEGSTLGAQPASDLPADRPRGPGHDRDLLAEPACTAGHARSLPARTRRGFRYLRGAARCSTVPDRPVS